ncbi:MAG: hypothetical protein FJX55_16905 [Alphaproteobacteria bacterium]|nr:hypothetical protein [Alphaproteobacteria bacterium]
MDRSTLHSQSEQLFGWGWQRALASGLGLDDRTVRRWGNDIPVPQYVDALLESLVALRRAGAPLPGRWTSSRERRGARRELQRLCALAFSEYRAGGLDNLAAPERFGRRQAMIVAEALESQGNVPAFRLGRQIRDLARRC